MFGSIGMPELIIILVIALIIFGPRKLPELGKSLGRSLNEFKKASTDLQNTLEQEIKIEEQKESAGQGQGRREDRVSGRSTRTTIDRTRTTTTRTPRRRETRFHRSYVSTVALVPFPSQNRHDDEQNLPAKPGGFSPFGDDEEPAGEGRMTFLEHLDELRKRITHAVGGLLVGFIIAFAFIDRVFDFVYQRLAGDDARRQADLHRSAARCSCCGSRSPR